MDDQSRVVARPPEPFQHEGALRPAEGTSKIGPCVVGVLAFVVVFFSLISALPF